MIKSKLVITILFGFIAGNIIAQSYIPERKNSKIKIQPKVTINAYAFNLKDVRLLSGSPFRNAMDKDAAYLLSIDEKRLLHRFYKNAGLPTQGDVYGGWENQGLSGHTLGHYLSACAMMYASTGEKKFKSKIDITITELEKCQQARKTGYIGAIPNEDSIFYKVSKGIIKSSGFDLNGGWSPWYTVHKVMAGLLDAYLYADNKKALTIVSRMADWTGNILKNLDESQMQDMLKCEYGGMNDLLANLYAVTGNKKYLDLSYKFYDEFVMVPLSKKIDPLPGKHSNTNVPKAIGSARQYELTGNESDKTIASFFWETMVHHHTYVIGGNSNYEYCGDADKLNDRLSDNTCETCNTYNMLKLTRHLHAWNPSSSYIDYYERALYNHILASQNPENGMMCYFVPLRMGTQKTFSDPFKTFTCCVGSGMENHAKYAESIYSEGADGSLYVNLFIPSTLNWKSNKLSFTQESKYPESDKINFTVKSSKSKTLTIHLRKPGWAKHGYTLKINDTPYNQTLESNGYIVIDRKWNDQDKMELALPMSIYSESMPDNKDRISFLYGPIVLAGELGDTMPNPVYGVPVLLTDNNKINEWLHAIPNESLAFEMKGVGKPFDVKLKPFYKTYKEYYSVYWDYFTNQQWQARQEEYENEKRIQKEIEDKTIDYFRIGEMQPERDHKLTASERSFVSDALGINGREARANHYFAFEMKVDPNLPDGNSLLLIYIGDDKDRKFDIKVNDQLLAYEEWKGGITGKFYNKTYALPVEIIKNKQIISVRIEANYGKTAGRVFGVRTVRN